MIIVCSYFSCSFERVVSEKRALEEELLEVRREMNNLNGGTAIKEIRLLKGLIKTLQDELQTLKTKQQRSSGKKTEELKAALLEVMEIIIISV